MVLVDSQIRDEINSGNLRIDNFDEACIQPATYDLRIGPLIYSPSSPEPDKPIDISRNGGAHRIPAYGFVVLTTYETLYFPPDMVGRFGLKSGFARKGLFASTGPQVDPGYEGKLFVSVLNLTPAACVVTYKDTFLSIEFNKLDKKPDKTYEGPHQGRRDISPEIIEDLVRFEGLNLSQMQNQFSELTHHINEWGNLAIKFENFLKEMTKQTNAITALTKKIGEPVWEQKDVQLIKTRHVSLQQALKEILELFRKERRLFYSDIVEALHLDYQTVMKACDRLEKKGLIEGDMHEVKKPRKKNFS
jgi:dCTP deaminase